MVVVEMLKKIREEKGVSQDELSKKTTIPVEVIAYLEEPLLMEDAIVTLFAEALDVTPAIFRGEEPVKPPEPEKPTEEEIRVAAVENAKYPNLRSFILDPGQCKTPQKARELFSKQELSLAEKNVILYLSTTALYNFCDTNISNFAFDEYLFKMHSPLLEKFKKELATPGMSEEEKDERIGHAHANIFACDTMENIAIGVMDNFACELEEKLRNDQSDYYEDLDLPFAWSIDEEFMKIQIKDDHGDVVHEIKLLDVKERK